MSFDERIEPFQYLPYEELNDGSETDTFMFEGDCFSGEMPEEILEELLEVEPEYINGYLWEGLIKAMINANVEFENADESLTYDSEAQSCVITSSDRSLLQNIAEQFREICDSETEFRELVESAEELDF